MARIRAQQGRLALSCFRRRSIFDYKIICFSKAIKTALVIPQINALHNTNAERVEQDPKTSGYLNGAFIVLNSMPLISRRLMLLSLQGIQNGALGLKNLNLRFIGEYRIDRYHSKLIYFRGVFPIQWFYFNDVCGFLRVR